MDYIDLSRRFRDLTQDELESPEFLASLNDLNPAIAERMSIDGWAELLQYPRVLVLAEAGSGKTTEMQGQAARLRAEGKPAFFVDLASLAREPLRNLLSPEEERTLDIWLSEGQSPAWFFLDAVDELKLTQGKLNNALNRFAKALDGHLHRVHCVISCRPSDFRRSVDLVTVQEKLPVIPVQEIPQPTPDDAFLAALRKQEHGREPKKKTKPVVGPRIVVLLPLSRDQIVAFASSLGVTDTAPLIEEIRRRDAWTFARRPLDLINLVALWKVNSRLGTRAEQHAANVTAKLADDPDRPDHDVLSDERARRGAERLALALALTHTRTIQSPEQVPSTERAEGVLDPREVLADWKWAERKTLLRRALFDPATYGRVRFHHRSVQEYLAACKLKELRDKGLPVKNLHRLLFAELYGMPLVKPAMQAIAAWLALWDDDVRRELMEREPETLISMGDPESLPIDARSSLLREFAMAYGQGGWRGLNIPMAEVRRLAHPALAGAVRELWNANPASPDVTKLLLEIIWQGPIAECADIARIAAFDVSQPDVHRVFATRALVACSGPAVTHELSNSILHEPEKWPGRITQYVIVDLFPNDLNVGGLITLAQRFREPKDTAIGFSRAMRQVIETIDPAAEVAIELREALADLIWQGRHEEQDCHHLRGRFDHVAPALARLCDRQLEKTSAVQTPDANLIWACAVANRFGANGIGTRNHVQNLKKHFKVRVVLRKAAFWAEFGLISEAAPEPNAKKQCFRTEQGSLIIRLTSDDRPWLLEALRDSPNPTHRLVALHASLELCDWRALKQGELDELSVAVCDDAALAEILRQRSRPADPEPERGRERKARRQWLVREGHERQRIEKWWVDWKEQILADPAGAFTGEKLRVTRHCLRQWLELSQGSISSSSLWNENALRAAFGDDIAARAAKAFQAVWRANPPTLRSQRYIEDEDRSLPVWGEGLIGLAAEATTPGWAFGLNPDEARVAAAYAMIHFGEFPWWLRDLAAEHPSAVIEVIGSGLTAELSKYDGCSYLPTLQNLSYAESSVKRLLAPHLLSWLSNWPSTFQNEGGSQRSAHHLRQMLDILHDPNDSPEQAAVAEICSRKVSGNPDGPLALTWLRSLFRFDPEKATQTLEDVLASLPEQERSGRAIAMFSDLFGHRDIVLDFGDDRRRATSLGHLVRCAYRYVRPAEDQEHEGVFTPDIRDDAERAREFLLIALLDTPGPAVHEVILNLAKDPLFAHRPDRLLLLERKRAARDAESPALTAEEVVALERRFEAPPNDRDSLFACMIDRLDDLAHDLAHHEFTNRRTLQKVEDEAEIQSNLARSLLDTARGAYKILREVEVADLKKPDILLVAIRCDQKAAIEVKIADNWTLPQLEGALRDQLVGQYLRHITCKAGCLLLTYHGRKKRWKQLATRRWLSFPEVVEHLRSLAREMNSEFMLHVCPLDLTNPLVKSEPEPCSLRSQPRRGRKLRRGGTTAKPRRSSDSSVKPR